MEEKAAFQAAAKVVAELKAHSDPQKKEASPAMVIQSCRQFWRVFKKETQRKHVSLRTGIVTQWKLPQGFDQTIWAKYQKDAPEEDLIVLLLISVFKFSEEEVAGGIQTSPGTVRYRLGKSVRQLGILSGVGAVG